MHHSDYDAHVKGFDCYNPAVYQRHTFNALPWVGLLGIIIGASIVAALLL